MSSQMWIPLCSLGFTPRKVWIDLHPISSKSSYIKLKPAVWVCSQQKLLTKLVLSLRCSRFLWLVLVVVLLHLVLHQTGTGVPLNSLKVVLCLRNIHISKQGPVQCARTCISLIIVPFHVVRPLFYTHYLNQNTPPIGVFGFTSKGATLLQEQGCLINTNILLQCKRNLT